MDKQQEEKVDRVDVVCNGFSGTLLITTQAIVCKCESCLVNPGPQGGRCGHGVFSLPAAEGMRELTICSRHSRSHTHVLTNLAPNCKCRVMTPTEFERHAGMSASKKWRRSIKVEKANRGANLSVGRWLEQHGFVIIDPEEGRTPIKGAKGKGGGGGGSSTSKANAPLRGAANGSRNVAGPDDEDGEGLMGFGGGYPMLPHPRWNGFPPGHMPGGFPMPGMFGTPVVPPNPFFMPGFGGFGGAPPTWWGKLEEDDELPATRQFDTITPLSERKEERRVVKKKASGSIKAKGDEEEQEEELMQAAIGVLTGGLKKSETDSQGMIACVFSCSSQATSGDLAFNAYFFSCTHSSNDSRQRV